MNTYQNKYIHQLLWLRNILRYEFSKNDNLKKVNYYFTDPCDSEDYPFIVNYVKASRLKSVRELLKEVEEEINKYLIIHGSKI